MNRQISWDHSLIKKYGSSNHFKLLNQLRSEIKKYPLNKKANLISNDQLDSTNKINISNTQEKPLNSFLRDSTEINNNKTTVSFNNSKNFSIYNNQSRDYKKEQ